MKNKKIPDNQVVFYQSLDRAIHLEVMYAEENIWLDQNVMGELFACSADNNKQDK